VGGINSWGSVPLEQYRLNKKTYSYAYCLLPLSGNVEQALSNRAAFKTSKPMILAVPNVSLLPEIKAPQSDKKGKRK
jgi:hypothetical protein